MNLRSGRSLIDFFPLFFHKKIPPETLIPKEYLELLCALASNTLPYPGDLIEVGVYKGGSLYRIAEYLQANFAELISGKYLLGIDTFSGHPYHDEEFDPKHHYSGRFSDTSFNTVRKALKPFRFVKVIQGECGEVFQSLPASQKFCFAHVDVDIAKSAVLCTEYIFSRLSIGGIIIYDEYRGYGQETFLNEFYKDRPVKLEERKARSSDNYGLIVTRLA